MRVLITGATGFVGSHLVETLAVPETGRAVRVLTRASSDVSLLEGLGVERVTGHLGDLAALEKAVADVGVIFHLAALTRARNEREFQAANETGTRLLLEAARASGSVKRFVYVSSLAAAGPAREGRPVTPDDVPGPLTAYGRSKLAGEKACGDFREAFQVAVLRPPAVYGPRDRDLLVFFQLASRGFLPVPGGPVRSLQMIHVGDLARAIAAAGLAEGATGVYHVAEAQAYAWMEVLESVSRAVGKAGRRIPIPQSLLRMAGGLSGALGRLSRRPPIFDGDKARELLAPGWLCETDGAKRDLGFETAIPLERGLKETAAWYRGRGWLR